jgi:Flp pilus assembly protein TadG
MVEFLIVLPVMLMLVMGIMQIALIYKAKITLNYATFQTVRAGSLNSASLEDMNMAFSSNMAPLYTTSYLSMDSGGDCESTFNQGGVNEDAKDAARTARVGTTKIMGDGLRGILDANINNFNSESVLCARRIVQEQIEDEYVRITVVNPSPGSFTDYGVDGQVVLKGSNAITTETIIPNDNLMYRDSKVIGGGASDQSIQDANLLKIHVGYCYELIIPFVNRMIWAMQAYGPGAAPESEKKFGRYWADPNATPPGFFGPPTTDFAKSCIEGNRSRPSIVLYSQGIMRMQSPAIECNIDGSC